MRGDVEDERLEAGTSLSWLEDRRRDPRVASVYAEERAAIDATERVCEAMELAGISKARLACRLGTTRAAVTQMLRGSNLTVKRLARVLDKMGFELVISIRRRDSADAEEMARGVEALLRWLLG